MNKTTLKIKNFKGISNEKTLEFSPEGINVIFCKNTGGKTSVIQAYEQLIMANNFVKKPLTDGQDKGFIEYDGPDKNGNHVTITETFDKEGNAVFTAVTKDEFSKLKAISNVKKMQELMGEYYPLTAKDVFEKVKYSEGRRELIDKYLYLCLTESQRTEIAKLEISVSSKKNKSTEGNLYFRRQELNKEIDVLNKTSNPNLTDEEKDLISKEDRYKEKKTEFQNEIEKNNEEIKKLEEQLAKLNNANSALNTNCSKIDIVLERINGINGRVKSVETNKVNLALKTTEVQKIEKEMVIAKEKKKNIYKNSKLPAGLEIDEDEIILNGRPIDVTSTSEAETYLAIIELMCQINEAKLIAVGSISEFDQKHRNAMIDIANKTGHMILATEVVSEYEEPEVKVIIKK